ncbi:MAG: hypothetical protein ABIN91_23155 [Mucilaginibacter sp.]|uniref:hypothetical protein n=1 Tax=Mucilaginibacter sp. TaxID=1882438 RepID=UPI0032650518
MKKIHLLLFLSMGCLGAFAQKYVPQITAGTQIAYTVSKDGESIAFRLNIHSISDSLKMDWEVSEYGNGSYTMALKSLQNGKKMVLKVPLPDEVTQLPDTETMGFISRSAFKCMAKNKFMVFDNMKYILSTVTTPPINSNGQELDVIHAVSVDGRNQLWILNNPDFPLICKTINNIVGANLTLRYIK